MADKAGKYAAAFAAITNQRQSPRRASADKGSYPEREAQHAGMETEGGLLKEEMVERTMERLKRRGDRTDFCDLMKALLEAWLQSGE